MKVAIIDDEMHCIKSLTWRIQHLFPEFEIVFQTTKPREGLKLLFTNEIDLLFLDVEMPGINGFELLESLGAPIPFDIIFTTAYSHYAIQAIKIQAINYLLKPIDEKELIDAIQNWRNTRESGVNNAQISALLEGLKRDGLLENKVAVPILEGFEFVDVKSIVYCQSENNYTNITFDTGRRLLISKTLKEFEKVLENYHFIRVHQSYLINPNYMQRYIRNDGGFVVLTGGLHIPVSPSKRELITKFFETITR